MAESSGNKASKKRQSDKLQSTKSQPTKSVTAIREPYTKTRLIASIADDTGLSRKDVAAVFHSLAHLMHRHLKKRAAGVFTLPGLAKFTVSTRKATKERQGRNPFTGEDVTFAAKPTRRIVRIRALKAVQEMAKTPCAPT